MELFRDKMSALPNHRRSLCRDVFPVKVDEDQSGHDFDKEGYARYTDEISLKRDS